MSNGDLRVFTLGFLKYVFEKPIENFNFDNLIENNRVQNHPNNFPGRIRDEGENVNNNHNQNNQENIRVNRYFGLDNTPQYDNLINDINNYLRSFRNLQGDTVGQFINKLVNLSNVTHQKQTPIELLRIRFNNLKIKINKRLTLKKAIDNYLERTKIKVIKFYARSPIVF